VDAELRPGLGGRVRTIVSSEVVRRFGLSPVVGCMAGRLSGDGYGTGRPSGAGRLGPGAGGRSCDECGIVGRLLGGRGYDDGVGRGGGGVLSPLSPVVALCGLIVSSGLLSDIFCSFYAVSCKGFL